jgi:CheY-like chemotaxis protein
LVVDDEDTVRRINARFLRRLGCSSIQLDDGSGAVLYMQRVRDGQLPCPDALLMDIIMQAVHGDAAAAQIRAMGFDTLPLIAATSNTSAADQRRYLAAGFNHVLTKPFDARAIAGAFLTCGLRPLTSTVRQHSHGSTGSGVAGEGVGSPAAPGSPGGFADVSTPTPWSGAGGAGSGSSTGGGMAAGGDSEASDSSPDAADRARGSMLRAMPTARSVSSRGAPPPMAMPTPLPQSQQAILSLVTAVAAPTPLPQALLAAVAGAPPELVKPLSAAALAPPPPYSAGAGGAAAGSDFKSEPPLALGPADSPAPASMPARVASTGMDPRASFEGGSTTAPDLTVHAHAAFGGGGHHPGAGVGAVPSPRGSAHSSATHGSEGGGSGGGNLPLRPGVTLSLQEQEFASKTEAEQKVAHEGWPHVAREGLAGQRGAEASGSRQPPA